MYYKKIEGKEVYLSPVDPEDCELSTKWLNDRLVSECVGIYYKLNSLDKERKELESAALDGYLFAIVKKEMDQLIGFCEYNNINLTHQRAEFFIYIGEKQERGKGYGKDALYALLEYGFGTLNLNNIMLRVYSFNLDAIGFYEKLGFSIIGRRREAFYREFSYVDEIYMDMTKSDYMELRKQSFQDKK